MEEDRVIEVYDSKEKTWSIKHFEDLAPDDIFRIFDYGERYTYEGCDIWQAKNKPYKDFGNDGILTINAYGMGKEEDGMEWAK